MNKQKFTDALTALETSTQLHKDAIGFSQRAIESNQLAVKLLMEAAEIETKNDYETNLFPTKHILVTDAGTRIFSTDDSYRKYIVDLSKEELNGLDNRTVNLNVLHKKDDIIESGFDPLKGNWTRIRFNEVFHVNKEKRTVVCLLVGHKTGQVYSRGIAKCDPNDTFNENLGKLISFYRAAKEEVPEIFLTVPNPENAKDGDLVTDPNVNEAKWTIQNLKELDNERVVADWHVLGNENVHRNYSVDKKFFDSLKILDDSNRK